MKKELPLRVAHRLIAGCPLVLLTAVSGELVEITTVPWVVPLSLDPLQVGVVVYPRHFSYDVIDDAEEFALNVVCLDILKQARYCGTVSGREVDKFKQTGLTPTDATQIEAPLIEECIGHLECGLVDRHIHGDHTLFVGQVLSASAEEGLFDVAWNIAEKDRQPVFHLGKTYYSVWDARFEPSPEK